MAATVLIVLVVVVFAGWQVVGFLDRQVARVNKGRAKVRRVRQGLSRPGRRTAAGSWSAR